MIESITFQEITRDPVVKVGQKRTRRDQWNRRDLRDKALDFCEF